MEVDNYGATPLAHSLNKNLRELANFFIENIKPEEKIHQLSIAVYKAAAKGGPGDDHGDPELEEGRPSHSG